MSSPYIGEIRLFAGTFAPAGWEFCEGQLLAISENDVLFALIGTAYGGDGQSTFALPDLRGRLPVHLGGGFVLGQTGGVEQVTLAANQIPSHGHALQGTTGLASQSAAQGAYLAQTEVLVPYFAAAPTAQLAPASIGSSGAGQPHTNLQPYLCVNFIISLFGIFPSKS